jgi:hypothetical protein
MPPASTAAASPALSRHSHSLVHQQICAKPAEHKGREQQQVVGDSQPRYQLQRDAQEPIERCQCVKGQVDVHGVEHPAAMKQVGIELVDQPQLDPPEVPCQCGIVNAIAGDMGSKVRGKRPGEAQRQQRVDCQRQAGALPTPRKQGWTHYGAGVFPGVLAGAVPAGVASAGVPIE